MRESGNKISKVSDNIESLKRRNEELAEDIIGLQGRSMRDNLFFFGFEECRNSVKLEHAHRIGKITVAKNRPIVVKFNSYQDKLPVKNTCI